MRLLHKLIVSIIFSLNVYGFTLSVYCQDVNKAPIIPPLPNSYSFATYGNFQPTLQYGMVNVPIPIYQLNEQDVTIPINLQYSTSGISTSSNPFPVGHGWIITGGYRITRTILGRPDDFFKFQQLFGGEDYQTAKKGILDEGLSGLHLLSDGDLFDSQKDIFTVGLPTGNHKFIISRNGGTYDAISIGSNIKIEFLTDPNIQIGDRMPIQGFRVTDENGNVFIFGDEVNSTTSMFTERTDGSYSTTAWMLREVIMINDQRIHYTWERANINGTPLQSYTPITLEDYKIGYCGEVTNSVIDEGGIIEYFSFGAANALLLKKIVFPNGILEMNYKNYNEPMLLSLTVRNIRNEIIKNVGFSYGSSNQQGDNLLLMGLDINNEIYQFEYDPQRFNKASTSQDYWGFFNGKPNATLVPLMTLRQRFGSSSGYGNFPPDISVQVGHADRSVSSEHMQASILKKITYPTKGYTTFEYEAHEFVGQENHSTGLFLQPPIPLTKGGGLRISRTKSYSSPSSEPVVKSYKYGFQEDGLANIEVAPTLETFLNEYWIGEEIESGPNNCNTFQVKAKRVIQVSGISNYSRYLIYENPIWYTYVTEYMGNDSKIDYKFGLSESYGISWQISANVVKVPTRLAFGNLFNQGPDQISSTYYKKNGATYSPIKYIENEYEKAYLPDASIPGAILDRKMSFVSSFLQGPDLYPLNLYRGGAGINLDDIGGNWYNYNIYPYSIHINYRRLKSVLTRDYDEGGQSSEALETMFYDGSKHIVLKRDKSTSVDAQHVITEYKYPYHYSTPPYAQMSQRNMFQVVETKQVKNHTVISKNKVNYANFIVDGVTSINPSSTEEYNAITQASEIRQRFDKYDLYGNVIETVAKESSLRSVYLWGKGGLNPIAKIENAKWNEVFYEDSDNLERGKLGRLIAPGINAEFIMGAPLPENCIRFGSSVPYIENLSLTLGKRYVIAYWGRSKLFDIETEIHTKIITSFNDWNYYQTVFVAGSDNFYENKLIFNTYGSSYFQGLKLYPEDAMMTTMTYKPLIGITSITSPNGLLETYVYDDYQRLSYISNHKGAVIKSFCYNFKGDDANCSQVWFLSERMESDFAKNNCLVGQNADLVQYVVPAGKHRSSISQYHANLKAERDLYLNGQDYANINGTCTTPITFVNVEIQKYTDWNGNISRIQFFKENVVGAVYEVFPSNSSASEIISIPEGEYSSIKFIVDGTGTPYSAMVSILNSNQTVCAPVGMTSTEITLINIKFDTTGSKLIVLAEYCLN